MSADVLQFCWGALMAASVTALMCIYGRSRSRSTIFATITVSQSLEKGDDVLDFLGAQPALSPVCGANGISALTFPWRSSAFVELSYTTIIRSGIPNSWAGTRRMFD